ELRTSQSPRRDARGRQVGMPTGQPNSTAAMSVPTIRLSSRESAFSHLRTGSTPVAALKKVAGRILRLLAVIGSVYLLRYIVPYTVQRANTRCRRASQAVSGFMAGWRRDSP